MRHLFRELGAAVILLFALNINAQTLVGLPEFSVTLTGTASEPIVLNNNRKQILAYAVRFSNAQGVDLTTAPISETENLRNHRPVLMSAFAGRHFVSASGGTIAKARLDAVLFADGAFVGPDSGGSINIIRARVDAERQAATEISNSHWDVDSLVGTLRAMGRGPARVAPSVPHTLEQSMITQAAWIARHMLIQDLVHALNHESQARAEEILQWSKHLPLVHQGLLNRIFIPNPLRLLGAIAHAQTVQVGDWDYSTYGCISWGCDYESNIYGIPVNTWGPPSPLGSAFVGTGVNCINWRPGARIGGGLSQFCNCDGGCYVVLHADNGDQIGEVGYVLAQNDSTWDPANPDYWIQSWGELGEECSRTDSFWVEGPGTNSCTP